MAKYYFDASLQFVCCFVCASSGFLLWQRITWVSTAAVLNGCQGIVLVQEIIKWRPFQIDWMSIIEIQVMQSCFSDTLKQLYLFHWYVAVAQNISHTIAITETRLFKYIENFTTKKGIFFFIKTSYIFHISVQNIDCGYSLEPPLRGGSNEYTQSLFLSRNKKNNVYPCKPQFYYIKVGFKGVNII